MIGRLVQQKDIRLGKKDFGQFDTHVPALAESFGGPVQFFIFEAEAHKRPLCLYPRIFRPGHRKTVIYFVEPDYEIMIFPALIIFPLRKFIGDVFKLRLHFKHLSKRRHCLINDRLSAMMLHNLWQISYLDTGRDCHTS